MILTAPAVIRDRLANARVIAVLGAHDEVVRPAFYVPEYLHRQGYRILPVNPALVGETLWGEPVVASLGALPAVSEQGGSRVDLIDIFRRAEALPAHLDELIAACQPGTLVWFQLGIRNDAVARALDAAGLDVVQDRCTLADHRAWGIGPVPATPDAGRGAS